MRINFIRRVKHDHKTRNTPDNPVHILHISPAQLYRYEESCHKHEQIKSCRKLVHAIPASNIKPRSKYAQHQQYQTVSIGVICDISRDRRPVQSHEIRTVRPVPIFIIEQNRHYGLIQLIAVEPKQKNRKRTLEPELFTAHHCHDAFFVYALFYCVIHIKFIQGYTSCHLSSSSFFFPFWILPSKFCQFAARYTSFYI